MINLSALFAFVLFRTGYLLLSFFLPYLLCDALHVFFMHEYTSALIVYI